ncbi:MAG: hypothetical protein NVSMB57_13360 [Actinomycetota bacterium]
MLTRTRLSRLRWIGLMVAATLPTAGSLVPGHAAPAPIPQCPTGPAAKHLPLSRYPAHSGVTATVFWAGELPGPSNSFITNTSSAWDGQWTLHYGGSDDPKLRSGYCPAAFVPKENPFYFALPYNDFDASGVRKAKASKTVPWSRERAWSAKDSMVKNHWIGITANGKTVYAQWEDVGPYGEDDVRYVFGRAKPASPTNRHAGLDVSPAVRDALGLIDGINTVRWQFVPQSKVPPGPWLGIVTTSQVTGSIV